MAVLVWQAHVSDKEVSQRLATNLPLLQRSRITITMASIWVGISTIVVRSTTRSVCHYHDIRWIFANPRMQSTGTTSGKFKTVNSQISPSTFIS
jgi:hypothetical protein